MRTATHFSALQHIIGTLQRICGALQHTAIHHEQQQDMNDLTLASTVYTYTLYTVSQNATHCSWHDMTYVQHIFGVGV